MAAPTRAKRRPPRVVSANQPNTQSQPGTFDFDEFLDGFRRPEFTASLIRRADLAPQLTERLKVLEDLDERIDLLERAEGDEGEERDITALNPLAELTERRQRMTVEFNDLANTYNESAVQFTFRAPDKKEDHAKIEALMSTTGLTQPTAPEPNPELPPDVNAAAKVDFEKEFSVWWDALAIRSMAVTCIEHPGTAQGAAPLTVLQWETLRDRVGAVAFASLAQAWFEAVQAVAPSAPFLQRHLPTPETETR